MIAKKCQEWYESPSCTVANIIENIKHIGKMRDVQIEAIKIYMFLKIECDNKPLHQLFSEGKFNTINIDELELKQTIRDYFKEHVDAVSFLEYMTIITKEFDEKNQKTIELLKNHPEKFNCSEIFKELFYNVKYSDYIFSLPMGAGKTYLMAALMYLDLYFSSFEPDNKRFAHNFIVLAPSGTKSSVIPSLKSIKSFDPEWIFDKIVADRLRHEIKFEVLDMPKTQSKSTRTKNPNVQKIALNMNGRNVRGLVLVTNAEKVILDHTKLDEKQNHIIELDEDQEDRLANELRNRIGRIPNLAIMIDEVHHASRDSIKLRMVVTNWAKNDTINCVMGFTGTPYLEKAEKINLPDKSKISSSEITNVVYYYPLINGIGNFLKKPLIVKYENREKYSEIIDNGLRSFFETYKEKKYTDGTWSKIAIYCTTVEKLEEIVHPLVVQIAEEYGFNPTETVLKFHGGGGNNGNMISPRRTNISLAYWIGPYRKYV
ncbi:MAG: DEAD/DEAH box helicase family protein [Candidatus Methanoplasma sp.]|jgi:hypothetical protein|nr:DEAD/DEAH box helicase family protein [Candidatus Methanoplasma sp.]